MALYDTRFGLPQSMVDYLNQGLPNIDQPLTVDLIDSQPIEDEEDQVLEQLYPQNYQGSGDGGGPFNISVNDPNVRTIRNYNARPAYEAAAKTRVLIEFTDSSKQWSTIGVHENIINASWNALCDGFNYYFMTS